METRNTLVLRPFLPHRASRTVEWPAVRCSWRDGPLASNLFESTAFIRSSAATDRPDLQMVFQPARRNRNLFPLPLGHGFAISSVGLYPKSRGRVHLASGGSRRGATRGRQLPGGSPTTCSRCCMG